MKNKIIIIISLSLVMIILPVNLLASDTEPTYHIAYGNINSNGVITNGAGATSWKPAVNSQEYQKSSEQQGENHDGSNAGLVSIKYSPFPAPAIALFSVVGQPDAAVRFTKNKKADRTQYAQSDSYSLLSQAVNAGDESSLPTERNLASSFFALARSNLSAQDLGDQKNGSRYYDSINHPDGTLPAALTTDAALQVAALRYDHGMVTMGDRAYNVSSALPTNEPGQYQVFFDNPFAEIPTVLLTHNGNDADGENEAINSVYVVRASPDSVVIGITDQSGHFVNGSFTMMAVGLPSRPSSKHDVYRLSNMDIAYGRYKTRSKKQKKSNESRYMTRTFGNRTSDEAKQVQYNSRYLAATFNVEFTHAFSHIPFVLVTVEHESEQHLRQQQVLAKDGSAVTVQVVGRDYSCCESDGAGLKGVDNDARFNIIAFYPKAKWL